MKKRKGFGHVVMLLSIIAISISSTTILNYYKVKTLEAKLEYKAEWDSFVKAEINNIVSLCSTNLVNHTYSKPFNYGKQANFILNCNVNVGPVITFDLEACRPKDMNTVEMHCRNYTGNISF